jgi:hypothetical protein
MVAPAILTRRRARFQTVVLGWIAPLAEPRLLMAPTQALGYEDLADAAPLDRDALLLVEVGPQAVQCPEAEG